MKKALYLTQQHFEISCSKTPEYLSWHRMFKREFSKFLKEHGIETRKFSSPNHFDLTGFFQRKDGQIFYFSISDIRWSKDTMLVRTANSFQDFTGGMNQFVPLGNVDCFKERFESIISKPSDNN